MTVKAVVDGTKDIITTTVGAPIWVKQMAESIMVIAVSLSAIGIDFAPYFNARAEVSIMKMKAEVIRTTPNDSIIQSLELRIKELEQNTHKAKQR